MIEQQLHPYRRVGIVGVGRMGSLLALRLAEHYRVLAYDRNPITVPPSVQNSSVVVCNEISELLCADVIILAVPDREVINCIKELKNSGSTVGMINIATNVAQSVLDDVSSPTSRCINVKMIGQANEMLQGGWPVVIVNHLPEELVSCACELFSYVGKVSVDRADQVMQINNVAAEMALTTAVQLEQRLRAQGVTNKDVIASAIAQVAAGVLKAYARDDLGPFAREIVAKIKVKTGF